MPTRSSEEVVAVLKKHGLPDPPETPIDVRYSMSHDEWMVKTDEARWFLLIGDTWTFLPYGPLDMLWPEWR